ncbi:hypothetical protein D3C84_702180 [compost metagenome]
MLIASVRLDGTCRAEAKQPRAAGQQERRPIGMKYNRGGVVPIDKVTVSGGERHYAGRGPFQRSVRTVGHPAELMFGGD